MVGPALLLICCLLLAEEVWGTTLLSIPLDAHSQNYVKIFPLMPDENTETQARYFFLITEPSRNNEDNEENGPLEPKKTPLGFNSKEIKHSSKAKRTKRNVQNNEYNADFIQRLIDKNIQNTEAKHNKDQEENSYLQTSLPLHLNPINHQTHHLPIYGKIKPSSLLIPSYFKSKHVLVPEKHIIPKHNGLLLGKSHNADDDEHLPETILSQTLNKDGSNVNENNFKNALLTKKTSYSITKLSDSNEEARFLLEKNDNLTVSLGYLDSKERETGSSDTHSSRVHKIVGPEIFEEELAQKESDKGSYSDENEILSTLANIDECLPPNCVVGISIDTTQDGEGNDLLGQSNDLNNFYPAPKMPLLKSLEIENNPQKETTENDKEELLAISPGKSSNMVPPNFNSDISSFKDASFKAELEPSSEETTSLNNLKLNENQENDNVPEVTESSENRPATSQFDSKEHFQSSSSGPSFIVKNGESLILKGEENNSDVTDKNSEFNKIEPNVNNFTLDTTTFTQDIASGSKIHEIEGQGFDKVLTTLTPEIINSKKEPDQSNYSDDFVESKNNNSINSRQRFSDENASKTTKTIDKSSSLQDFEIFDKTSLKPQPDRKKTSEKEETSEEYESSEEEVGNVYLPDRKSILVKDQKTIKTEITPEKHYESSSNDVTTVGVATKGMHKINGDSDDITQETTEETDGMTGDSSNVDLNKLNFDESHFRTLTTTEETILQSLNNRILDGESTTTLHNVELFAGESPNVTQQGNDDSRKNTDKGEENSTEEILTELCFSLENEKEVSLFDLLSGNIYVENDGKRVLLKLRDDPMKNCNSGTKKCKLPLTLKTLREKLENEDSLEEGVDANPANNKITKRQIEEDEKTHFNKEEKLKILLEKLMNSDVAKNVDRDVEDKSNSQRKQLCLNKLILRLLSNESLITSNNKKICPHHPPEITERDYKKKSQKHISDKLISFLKKTNENKNSKDSANPNSAASGNGDQAELEKKRFKRTVAHQNLDSQKEDSCGCSSMLGRTLPPIPNYEHFLGKRLNIITDIAHAIKDVALNTH